MALPIEHLLQHNLFQTHREIEEFIEDVNTELQRIWYYLQRQSNQRYNPGLYAFESQKLQMFERGFPVVTQNQLNWHNLFPPFMHVLDKWNTYHNNWLVPLVRFIRNFLKHFDEICEKQSRRYINYRQDLENEIGGNKLFFLPYILNKLPNLLPILRVYYDTLLFLRSPRSPPTFMNNYSNICWIITDFTNRALALDKKDGKLLAAFVQTRVTQSGTREKFKMDFLKRTKDGPTEGTIILAVSQYAATLKIRRPDRKYPDDPIYENVSNFHWSDWEAEEMLIIITDNYMEALDVFELNNFPQAMAYLGNFDGNIKPLVQECNERRGYRYIQSSWGIVDPIFRNTLKTQLQVRAYGEAKQLDWIQDDTNDTIFTTLKGELLRQTIDGKTPEVLASDRNIEFEKYSIDYGLTSNITDEPLVLSGGPFTGKDTLLLQLIQNIQDKLVLTLEALELLKTTTSNNLTTREIVAGLAELVTDNPFGKKLVLEYLGSGVDKVVILIKNFEAVLDFGDDLDEDDMGYKNYQKCLGIVGHLSRMPSVRLLISTRNHCVQDLQAHVRNVHTLPFLSKSKANDIMRHFTKAFHPVIFPDENSTFNNMLTPFFCRTICSMTAELDLSINTDRVKSLQAFCDDVFDKHINKIFVDRTAYIPELKHKLLLIHICLAFYCQYQSNRDELKFINGLLSENFTKFLTVSYLDVGFLTFQNPKIDKSKALTHIQQGISFYSPALANYFVAYGMFYISATFTNKNFRKDWGQFLKSIFNNYPVANPNHTEIVDYITCLHDEILSLPEKKSFKGICDEHNLRNTGISME